MGDPNDEQDRQDLHRMIRESITAISADYDWDEWLEHPRNNEFPTEFWDDLADAAGLASSSRRHKAARGSASMS